MFTAILQSKKLETTYMIHQQGMTMYICVHKLKETIEKMI